MGIRSGQTDPTNGGGIRASLAGGQDDATPSNPNRTVLPSVASPGLPMHKETEAQGL